MKEPIRGRARETLSIPSDAYHYGKSDRSNETITEKKADGTCVK